MESHEVRSEDQDAAYELLNEHPLLSEDSYAKRVVAEGGKVDNGKVVDIGNFLAARAAVLEQYKVEEKVAAVKELDPEAYEVAHSVRPDFERHLN